MIEKLVCMKDFQYIGGNFEPTIIHDDTRNISKGIISFEQTYVFGYAKIISQNSFRLCGFENRGDYIAYTNFLRRNIKKLLPRIFCRSIAKLFSMLFILKFIFTMYMYAAKHSLPLNLLALGILTGVLIIIVLLPGIFEEIDSV